jgi:hypothetical protein
MEKMQVQSYLCDEANIHQILDVYIYGDYELLSTGGNLVSQRREGSRIAEIRGRPEISQIICDVLETRTGKTAVCGTCSEPELISKLTE